MPGDGFGEEAQFRKVLELVDDPERRPVLVHCARGTCRTGSAVALYRFERDGWTIQDVAAELRRQSYRDGFIPGYIYAMVKTKPSLAWNRPITIDERPESVAQAGIKEGARPWRLSNATARAGRAGASRVAARSGPGQPRSTGPTGLDRPGPGRDGDRVRAPGRGQSRPWTRRCTGGPGRGRTVRSPRAGLRISGHRTSGRAGFWSASWRVSSKRADERPRLRCSGRPRWRPWRSAGCWPGG